MKYGRQVNFVVALFGLLLVCAPALIQAQNRLVIVPDLEFLDRQDYPFSVGEPFKINVDYQSLREAGALGRLKARVFRGTYEKLVSQLGRPTPNGCLSYFSTLFSPYEYNGGIDFGLNFTEDWLRPSGPASFTEEHFLLVFEIDGPESRRIDLDRQSVSGYFRKGFGFVVRADGLTNIREAQARIARMMEQARRVEEAFSRQNASGLAGGAGSAGGTGSGGTGGSTRSGSRQPAPTPALEEQCWRFVVRRMGTSLLSVLESSVCTEYNWLTHEDPVGNAG